MEYNANILPEYNNKMARIKDKITNKTKLDREEAKFLLEDVIDTLCEVGNGVTDKMLHEAADFLFAFRDLYLKETEKVNGI